MKSANFPLILFYWSAGLTILNVIVDAVASEGHRYAKKKME